MSTIECLFFYGMAAFLIIGLLLLCHRIDQLEKENETLKKENEDLENDLMHSK